MKYCMLDEKFQSRFSFYNDIIYTIEHSIIYRLIAANALVLYVRLHHSPKHSAIIVNLPLPFFRFSLLSLSFCFFFSLSTSTAHTHTHIALHPSPFKLVCMCVRACGCCLVCARNQNKHRVNSILRHSIHVHSKSF